MTQSVSNRVSLRKLESDFRLLCVRFTSFVRKVLRLSLQKIQNSYSQIMLPVRFEVVPSAVNTLLPAFLQVLNASFGMPVSSILAAA
jgi:hypothetical protein